MQTLVDKICKNTTCVFLYGTGYSDGKSLSCKASSRAVGMEISCTEEKHVTSDFFDNPDCHIELDHPIEIEEPKVEGGGFVPSVGDWDTEYRDIIL